jgi:hypothetical protein
MFYSLLTVEFGDANFSLLSDDRFPREVKQRFQVLYTESNLRPACASSIVPSYCMRLAEPTTRTCTCVLDRQQAHACLVDCSIVQLALRQRIRHAHQNGRIHVESILTNNTVECQRNSTKAIKEVDATCGNCMALPQITPKVSGHILLTQLVSFHPVRHPTAPRKTKVSVTRDP